MVFVIVIVVIVMVVSVRSSILFISTASLVGGDRKKFCGRNKTANPPSIRMIIQKVTLDP